MCGNRSRHDPSDSSIIDRSVAEHRMICLSMSSVWMTMHAATAAAAAHSHVVRIASPVAATVGANTEPCSNNSRVYSTYISGNNFNFSSISHHPSSRNVRLRPSVSALSALIAHSVGHRDGARDRPSDGADVGRAAGWDSPRDVRKLMAADGRKGTTPRETVVSLDGLPARLQLTALVSVRLSIGTSC